MTSPEPVPPQADAVDAAEAALHACLGPWLAVPVHRTPLRAQIRTAAALAVRDAAPHLEAAARERLANRQQMVDEVKAELDDAFQFIERDGSHHSYVTREWVQVLIATQAASAAAAERERCAQLAEQEHVMYTHSPHGPGCPGHRRPFAQRLREQP